MFRLAGLRFFGLGRMGCYPSSPFSTNLCQIKTCRTQQKAKLHRATEISVHVVRAFLELRSLLVSNRELSNTLFQRDRKVSRHDKAIADLIDAMRQILTPSETPKRPIGFGIPEPFTKLKASSAKR
jgi:hypothetical protein